MGKTPFDCRAHFKKMFFYSFTQYFWGTLPVVKLYTERKANDWIDMEDSHLILSSYTETCSIS